MAPITQTSAAPNLFMDMLFRAMPILASPQPNLDQANVLFEQFIDERVQAALAKNKHDAELERLVDSREAAVIIGGTNESYVGKLRRRGELSGHRTPGTRHFYYKVGDLKKWLAANSRLSDGGRKYSTPASAAGAKREKGQATV